MACHRRAGDYKTGLNANHFLVYGALNWYLYTVFQRFERLS